MRIGTIELASPVVLAPMAGVTNVAFRSLCRELEQSKAGTVSGLYVCEMVTARALVERHPVTMHMTTFSPDESPRSLQLYTVDPDTTFAAAKMIADEGLADHIDMNFGCPVPKVTKRGGGAALPYKRRLFGQIVAAAVRATEGTDIPVTVKFRIGIDDDHHTHLDAGRIAESEGAAAVALHARTAAQRYSGTADWDQIALLKQQVRTIPVLGNGDIYDASDALAMMAGDRMRWRRHRPRLPGPALAVRRVVGRIHRQTGTHSAHPRRGRRHHPAARRAAGGPFRRRQRHARHPQARRLVPARLPGRIRLAAGVGAGQDARRTRRPAHRLDGDVPFPEAGNGPRGRQGSPARVALPDGWLNDPDDCRVPEGADVMHSGG